MNALAKVRLADCVRLAKGKPPARQPYYGAGSAWYLTPEYLRGASVCESAKPSANAVHVQDGETVLLWDGSNAGEVFFGRNGMLASTMTLVSPDKRFTPHYFFFALKQWEAYLKGQTSGSGIPHVDKEVLGKLEIAQFAEPEQSKIAEVLSTVDRAIAQTEALIAKQQSIKTGLMQDLLTQGIDEHGQLRSEATHAFKDSPLGRIPVEWEVATVDEIATITTGDKDTQDADASAAYPFFVRSQTIERISSYSFDGEAVLTAGDGVGTGKVFHYIDGRFDYHQRVYCMHSFTNGVLGYYFFCYFREHFMERVAQFSAKGSVDSVRRHMIAKMLMPKPRPEEQEKVVHILRNAAGCIDDYNTALHKLRSLKTALMQDLLTGKIRVTPLLQQAGAASHG